MAYTKRYAGGFVDKPTLTTPMDSTFLNAVEAALLALFDTNPASANMVPVWTPAGTHYVPQLLTNASIDPAAAIAKSKLAPLSIVDADVSGAAAIARSKLNFGAGLTNADIAAAAAIALSKLAGYPADATKFARGDGTWAVPTAPPAPGFVAPPLTPTADTNWGANGANFCRVYIPTSFTVTKFNFHIGGSSGNMDVGIYSDVAGLPGARLWSRGSAASPGTGQQGFLISAGTPNALTLAAGTYWLALAMDNAVQTVATMISGAAVISAGLCAFQGAAFPLPANATAGAAAQGVHATLT